MDTGQSWNQLATGSAYSEKDPLAATVQARAPLQQIPETNEEVDYQQIEKQDVPLKEHTPPKPMTLPPLPPIIETKKIQNKIVEVLDDEVKEQAPDQMEKKTPERQVVDDIQPPSESQSPKKKGKSKKQSKKKKDADEATTSLPLIFDPKTGKFVPKIEEREERIDWSF